LEEKEQIKEEKISLRINRLKPCWMNLFFPEKKEDIDSKKYKLEELLT
jgi:hypothetical protein